MMNYCTIHKSILCIIKPNIRRAPHDIFLKKYLFALNEA